LFKVLQNTFHLSPESKQESSCFAFSLPTTVPEIPAYRDLLNLILYIYMGMKYCTGE